MASGDKAIIDSLREDNEWLRHHNERLRGNARENPTLRDQFAMAALTGMIASTATDDWQELATYSYNAADAMLKAREIKNED